MKILAFNESNITTQLKLKLKADNQKLNSEILLLNLDIGQIMKNMDEMQERHEQGEMSSVYDQNSNSDAYVPTLKKQLIDGPRIISNQIDIPKSDD